MISKLPTNKANNINKTEQKVHKILQIIVHADMNRRIHNSYQKKTVVKGVDFF